MFNIQSEIDKIPKNSKLIVDLKRLYSSKKLDDKKLLELIESNTFLKTEFLKMANSKLLGFDTSVDTIKRTIHLFGMNFSMAYALFLALVNQVRFHLDLYDCNFSKFMYLNEISLYTLFTWLEEKEIEIQEKVIFPLLASNIGKFISSKILCEDEESIFNIKTFLEDEKILRDYEEKKLGMSSLCISSKLLRHFSFENKDIEILEQLDNIFDFERKELYIIDTIRTLCNFKESFSKKAIENAFYKADIYSLNIKSLKDTISIVLKANKKGL